MISPATTILSLCLALLVQNVGELPAGIWSRGDTVLFFADVRNCGDDTPYSPIRLLISKDEGRTWEPKSSPLIDHELRLILEAGDEVWIAGEGYFEGPTHDPFLLVYRDGAELQEFTIYNGDSELLAVAHDQRNTNRVLAWFRPIDISRFGNDQQKQEPIVEYESIDRGRTWNPKSVGPVPKSAPGLRFFRKLSRRSGMWRIKADLDGTNARLERIDSHAEWRQISKLPLPIQNSCEP